MPPEGIKVFVAAGTTNHFIWSDFLSRNSYGRLRILRDYALNSSEREFMAKLEAESEADYVVKLVDHYWEEYPSLRDLG